MTFTCYDGLESTVLCQSRNCHVLEYNLDGQYQTNCYRTGTNEMYMYIVTNITRHMEFNQLKHIIDYKCQFDMCKRTWWDNFSTHPLHIHHLHLTQTLTTLNLYRNRIGVQQMKQLLRITILKCFKLLTSNLTE